MLARSSSLAPTMRSEVDSSLQQLVDHVLQVADGVLVLQHQHLAR